MAAADLSRSRGVDRTTKGLFFIFTLLCLVCFVSSLSNKDQLEVSKKKYLKLKRELDEVKAIYKSEMASAEIMSEYMTLIDPMITLMKKTNKLLSDDFPSVDKSMEEIKVYMMDTKAKVDRQNEEIRELIEDEEEKLIHYHNVVKFYEEQQADL